MTQGPVNHHKYFAFISYARKDVKWAKWLQRKLEHYNLPTIIRKRLDKDVPQKIRPIFLDSTDLGLGILQDNLSKELDSSNYLIVICSPAAAQSVWVNKEVQRFIEIGGAERIIPFVVSGTPDAVDEKQRCYPAALDKQLLGANVSELGKKKAFIKIVAFLLRIDFDTLWSRHKRRQRVRTTAAIVAVSLFACMAVAVAYKMIVANHERQLAEERAVVAKAYNLKSHALTLEDNDPAKAFLLYTYAYCLSRNDADFEYLCKYYDLHSGAYETDTNNKSVFLGYLNLFPKTIDDGYYIDLDSAYEATDELESYEEEDLVNYSLKRKLVLELHNDKIVTTNFDSHEQKVIDIDTLNIVNWQYNETQNCILLYCEGKAGKNDVDDIYIYNLDQNKFYRFIPANADEKPEYYLAENIHLENYSNYPTYESGPMVEQFYSMKNAAYAVFYKSTYMFAPRLKRIRKYIAMDLVTNNIGILTFPVDDDYSRTTVLSVSPDGQTIVVDFRSSYTSDKSETVTAFHLESSTNRQLYNYQWALPKPSVVEWMVANGEQYMLLGSNNGQVYIWKDSDIRHEKIFTTYKDYGGITSISVNSSYIFAGTESGYIICWKKSDAYGRYFEVGPVSVFSVSNFPVYNIQTDENTLMFQDGLNKVRSCKLNEHIKLSRDPSLLLQQISNMNIDLFSKQDSLFYKL